MERLLGFAVGTEPLVKAELNVDPSTYGRLIGRAKRELKPRQAPTLFSRPGSLPSSTFSLS